MEYLLHLDYYLLSLIPKIGSGIYLLLFLVIFLESACILTPFLPGDGLLFALGLLIAKNMLSATILIPLVFLSTVAGYTLNYFLGTLCSKKILPWLQRWDLEKHYENTRKHFHENGTNSLLLGRFIPIFRTFLPFVSGVFNITFSRFMIANLLGATIWLTVLFTFGWIVGKIPMLESFGATFIILIMIISMSPMTIGIIKHFIRRVKWSPS